eukprot:gene7579-9320_t
MTVVETINNSFTNTSKKELDKGEEEASGEVIDSSSGNSQRSSSSPRKNFVFDKRRIRLTIKDRAEENNSRIIKNNTNNSIDISSSGAYSRESFSIDVGMMWLLKSIERHTLQEHVCERILKLPHTDFQFFLPQIVHVCVVYNYEPIVRMLIEKCRQSIIIAAQTFFLLQSTVHDNNPNTCPNAKILWKKCEMAAIGIHNFEEEEDLIPTTLSDHSILIINEQYWSDNKDSLVETDEEDNDNEQEIEDNFENDISVIEKNVSNFKINNNEEKNKLSSSTTKTTTTTTSPPPLSNLKTKQQISTPPFSSPTSTKSSPLSSSPPPISSPTQSSKSTPLSSSTSDLPDQIKSSGNHHHQHFNNHNQNNSNNRLSYSTSILTNDKNTSILANSSNNLFRYSVNGDGKILLASTSSNPYTFCFDLLETSPNNKSFSYQPFYSEIHFISILSKVGTYLLSIPIVTDRNKLKDMRNASLRLMLKQLNDQLFGVNNSILLPVYPPFLVLGICHEEACCLNSRERVPYMIVLEVQVSEEGNISSNKSRVVDITGQDGDEEQITDNLKDVLEEDPFLKQPSNPLNIVFGENWKDKENRIWKTSQRKSVEGWRLISFIVKSGDDLRQEQLAMQLITQFHRIFQRSNLPLWLRPYLVIATGYDSGLIETVPDSMSVDTLKKKVTAFTTLSDYFIRCYGDRKSKSFIKAQTNFIESLAAYSLVCYFLQIKDRHNGNILIDTKGHLIHIDYGFILSISPGSMNFETAPFKLTKEYVELMGGKGSEKFHYFVTLLVCGFIEVRKHYQEFLMMIELLLPYTNLTCILKGGESAISNFKERFKLELTSDDQCQAYVEGLIEQSLDNWTTHSYDSYQYYTNGIV